MYLRADFICFLKDDWVKIKDVTPKYTVRPFYLDYFIHPNQTGLLPNFDNSEKKISIIAKNNYIKYVMSRGDYIFLFLNCNPIVFILQI